jgi:single-stranded-DNA-specific exonuclease
VSVASTNSDTAQTAGRWAAEASSTEDPGLSELASRVASEFLLPMPLASLLVSRGVDSLEAARRFLSPALNDLHDPAMMMGVPRAVERLRAALVADEPILIYGDYDVDGTIATVLLKTALERAGTALGRQADVRYHIPHRIREGYGMQDARIAAAAAEGVRLVVSVDTGIRGFSAAEEARRHGLDMIVTDHHLPEGMGLPDALVVINPNQPGCPYPYKDLCGAGVAFKLAQALLESTCPGEPDRERLRAKTLPSFLKLLAIATIADAVPLTGENRTIASLGLAELRRPSQAGLRSLMELAGIDTTRPISASDVGYRIGPRINAAGRMDVASDVVTMFLTRDEALARTLAEKLHGLNEQRRASEASALRAIEAQLEAEYALSTEGAARLPACLVLDDAALDEPWHRGVIGILASRVVDRTGTPAMVITHDPAEPDEGADADPALATERLAYGSGRSVAGFMLLDALTAAHEQSGGTLLTKFGGHAHAVGFTLPAARVPELRRRIEAIAAAMPDTGAAQHARTCDLVLEMHALTPALLDALELLGPFGIGNPEPLFRSDRVRLIAPPRILQERSLKLSFEDEGVRLSGVAWGRRTHWAAIAQQQNWQVDDRFDVLYRLRRNWHPQFAGWELEIIDLVRVHGSASKA